MTIVYLLRTTTPKDCSVNPVAIDNDRSVWYLPGKLLVILRPFELLFYTAKELEISSGHAVAAEFIQNINLKKPDGSLPKNTTEKIIHKIYNPNGEETLWLCQF